MDASPSKSSVANNGINYYYAESVSMMNDGMGSNNNWEDGANTGNIRYYGSNPNNYVYFNCSDYNNQSSDTCERWRIVGVFDDKVKIVSASSVFSDVYDNEAGQWINSTLNEKLNSGTYYAEIYNKNSKTIDLISSSTWYINGITNINTYANVLYSDERTCNYTSDGLIGLLYPSDFMYSQDLNSCTEGICYYWMNTFVDQSNM